MSTEHALLLAPPLTKAAVSKAIAIAAGKPILRSATLASAFGAGPRSQRAKAQWGRPPPIDRKPRCDRPTLPAPFLPAIEDK